MHHRLLIPAVTLVALSCADNLLAQDSPKGGRSLSSPEEQQRADDAMSTSSGRAGRDEPGAHAPTTNDQVLKGGKFYLPDASTQGQTTPNAPDYFIGDER
jgi:hypothetical protein